MPLKIALIGTTPSSRLLAPYDDQEWKIWVCSPGNSQQSAVPRCDIFFDLHAIVDMWGVENRSWCGPYFAWLAAQKFPVYMQEVNEHVPHAVPFPHRILLEEFGDLWFTSSVAWMSAFAIHQMSPGDELAYFGIDMAGTEEHYTAQKAGCMRFIEIAKERGIKVSIPYESCLGKPFPLYGYSEATNFGRKMNIRQLEMKQRRAEINANIERMSLERAYFDGALEESNYYKRTWLDGADYEFPHEEQKSIAPPPRSPVDFSKFQKLDSGLEVPKSALNGGGHHEEDRA